MYNYINQMFATAKGYAKDPSFISIEDAVIKNYSRIRERYISSSKVTPSTHIVTKLLKAIALKLDDTYDDIYYRAFDIIPNIGNSLRVTTPSSYGVEFTGQFMKSGTESILLNAEHFDESIPWYDLTPIKFLYHTNTNVNFQLGTDDDGALAIVKINYPMLAYQFLQWAKWVKSENVEQNSYHFISKYAIYNSLKSYMDISLFNRHYYRFDDRPIPDEPRVSEYPVPNLESRINRSNLTVVGIISQGAASTESALLTVPTFFSKNLFYILAEPDMVFTRQVEWIQIAHVLPYINFGITVANEFNSAKDLKYVHNLKRDLEAFLRTRTLDKLSPNTRVWLQNLIDDTLLKIAAYAN